MTIDEIRSKAKVRKAQFEASGQCPAHWADANNFRRCDVYRVLNGLTPCKRGFAHEIAVRLGIKPKTTGAH